MARTSLLVACIHDAFENMRDHGIYEVFFIYTAHMFYVYIYHVHGTCSSLSLFISDRFQILVALLDTKLEHTCRCTRIANSLRYNVQPQVCLASAVASLHISNPFPLSIMYAYTDLF